MSTSKGSTSIEGHCLCGAVQFVTSLASTSVGACHCELCRRWGGGPLLAMACQAPEFRSSQQIAVFASTAWAERGFCVACGTHLFIRVRQSGRYIMPAGLFELSAVQFDHQIFIDRKPDYYCFANQTRELTAAQVWAEHGSQPS